MLDACPASIGCLIFLDRCNNATYVESIHAFEDAINVVDCRHINAIDARVLARVCEGDTTFGSSALHFHLGLHPSKPTQMLKTKI